MTSILFSFLGLFIGSFLLVVVDRLPRGESIFFGRSHCDMCQHPLAWYDLIPFFSYLLLRGKCRYCHKAYGLEYPLVEISTAVVWGLVPVLFHFPSIWEYVLTFGILSSLIVIFFTDMFFGIIPDMVVLITGIFSSIFLVLSKENIVLHILIALVTALFFFGLYIGTKRKGIGLGDVKYAIVMGLLLGYPSVIIGLYSAFLTGALVALILIVRRKKHFRHDTISFGPFLVLGTYISWIGGIPLWHFLLHILFNT